MKAYGEDGWHQEILDRLTRLEQAVFPDGPPALPEPSGETAPAVQSPESQQDATAGRQGEP